MILQALSGYYDRMTEQESSTPKFGYGFAPISFAIVLRRDGTIADVNDLREQDGNKSRPIELLVPKDFEDRTSGDAAPRAFWDKVEYIFAVSENPGRAARRFKNFRDRHISLFGQTGDPGLRSILMFLAGWTPEKFSCLRYSNEMLAESNVVFRLDGEQEFIHERAAARAAWERDLDSESGGAAQCLVTGRTTKWARLHPLIKNIAKAGEPTPKLVSFDKDTDSFDSLGKKQGANAPVSERAAFAYTTALNDLLRRGSDQRVKIGDATTVFWAEAADPKEAEVAEQAAHWLFEPPSPEQQDANETHRLRTEVMERVAKGIPLDDPELKLAEGTRFYILGLSPNAARLSVRFWEATTLGAIGRAFHQHWQDLHIEPTPWRQPPALWRLLTRTATARRNQQGVVKYDAKQVPPNLAGELMRAILTGRPYPRTILSNALMRFRSDHVIDGLRVALVKASIVREMRLRSSGVSKEAYVSLNPDDTDAAYCLGRLFALLEKAQLVSIDGINATICDRYYGAAAATPARVFGFLIKNSKNHLAALRKGRGAKWVKKPAATGGWLDREIGAIHDAFNGSFPPSLTLDEQGRFSIGYYHQKYAKREDAPDDVKAAVPDAESDDSGNTIN